MMAAVSRSFLAQSARRSLAARRQVEEVERIHSESWRLGLKAIALYRDGSKLSRAQCGRIKRRRSPCEGREGDGGGVAAFIPDLTAEQRSGWRTRHSIESGRDPPRRAASRDVAPQASLQRYGITRSEGGRQQGLPADRRIRRRDLGEIFIDSTRGARCAA